VYPVASESGPLGRSGVLVTRLGVRCAPDGALLRAVVRRAREAGLRYFDTAPLYGSGASEKRLGQALKNVDRRRYALSTKVGRPVDGPVDFSAEGVCRSLSDSLGRLGLDRVDVVYLHDPDDGWLDRAIGEAYPVLRDLREQGVVGAIGVATAQLKVAARATAETDLDVVALAGRYTLLDRSAADDVLSACAARDVSVVAAGVYNSGVLADPRPGVAYDHAPVPAAVLARAQRLERLCASYGVPLRAAAIQFPLRHPAVACVLTGVRSVDEFEENRAMFGFDVPDALWAELEES